jgi:hypothetical protein
MAEVASLKRKRFTPNESGMFQGVLSTGDNQVRFIASRLVP